MKLHLRLALPLFAIALAVTLIGTLGALWLVNRTFSGALAQQGLQFDRISRNVLSEQSRDLNDAAQVLAFIDGPMDKRLTAWGKSRVDAAAVVDRRTGRVRSTSGPVPDAADLKCLPTTAPTAPLLLRTRDGLLLAGLSPDRNGRDAVIACRKLGGEFAQKLKDLLQADVVLASGDKEIASTLKSTSPEPKPSSPKSAPALAQDTRPVLSRFATASGQPVILVMHLPAEGALSARRTGLRLATVGGIVLLFLALVFYWWIVARVTRPIRELTRAADRIGGGDLESRLPPDAPAELGALVRQFNAMAVSLKETQEKLVHSAKLSSVGALVAGISHELNNPLLGLLGHAENLAGEYEEGTPAREKVETVIREARRMSRTLASLRDFTRPSGKDRVPTDLNQITNEVAALARHEMEKAGVKCELLLEKNGATINASPDQIRQVILNLVLNSVQAMPKGGELIISTIRKEGSPAVYSILVADTGTGISPELQNRVIEPFFSTRPGRMGLGLAICREIVSGHGGELKMESRPGQGTRVTIDLPMEKPS
jgi:signal transduction histidine kinase